MAYGTFHRKSDTFPVEQFAYFWGNFQSVPWVGNFPADKSVQVYRSGTNATIPYDKLSPSNPRPLIQVTKTVYKGPRLSYQVFNPKLMRWIWARQPLQVTRLVKAPYVKRKKTLKGSDLPPNALNYYSGTVEYYGLGQTVSTVHNSSAMVIASGKGIWADFGSWGGGSLGPSPQPYMGSYPDGWQGAVEELTNELIPILYDKVKNQDVNLAQALAEYRQSANMFMETLTRAGRALLALKKGRLSTASTLLFPTTPKQLANDWLLFQYGVKPLLSDIDGAAKMLATPENRYFDIVVRRKKVIPPRRLAAFHGLSGAWVHNTTVDSDVEVEVKYKVRLKITSPTANVDRELARLGFGNLSSVAWEVIPWSFIADWVIPIGDYLNNQDAFSGLTVVSAHKTIFVKERVVWSRIFGGYGGDGWRTAPSKPMGFINTRILCNRTVNIPIPELPKPSFKNPFSTGHFLNALALFTQLRSK